MNPEQQVRVLFVCLGNICRSPTAEGIFRHHVEMAGLSDKIIVDSAGTGTWHIGNPPDPRAIEAAADRGIDIGGQRARQVTAEDLLSFDYVLAMDRENLAVLEGLAAQLDGADAATPELFLTYATRADVLEVPDPYLEGGFDAVAAMIDDASQGLLKTIRSAYFQGE